jgi:hypothetical protein
MDISAGIRNFINGRLVNWAALVREAASRMAMLLESTFNVLGSCNFKWLRMAETAHPTTIARLIGRSVFGGTV